MSAKPRTVDEYLAGLSGKQRSALQRLRRVIKAAAPRAEECIAYNIPAYRLDGRVFVAFAAAAKHCSLYAGAAPVAAFKNALAAYGTSKGTIRFPAEEPLPDGLVRKLVKMQMAAKSRKRQ